ncbi:hypothetical protein F4801DRAFT_545322 [Xylaria longipes]|nr:hypothetical protein F4801DRAFT_545322 [Xylaria longipes]
MPPKRKAAGSAKNAAPKERQSKLAKEHNISAREEREIKEAFALFAEPMDGEKEGVIPTKDVRRAMVYVFSPAMSPLRTNYITVFIHTRISHLFSSPHEVR